jgi:hypothetical protein
MMFRRTATLAWLLGFLLVAAPAHARPAAEAICDLVGYSASARPDPPGTPTEVGIGLGLTDLSAINDVNQTITLEALFTMQWTDQRLGEMAGCRYDIAAIWTPDIQLLNSATIQSRQPPQLRIDTDGNVTLSVRYKATIASNANIAEFPFDDRIILLQLASLRYDKTELAIRIVEEWTGRLPELTIPDWTIGEPTVSLKELDLSRIERTLPVFEFRIPASRLADYYVYKFVFPLALIVMMSWAVFWVDPQNLGPQLSLAGTSMLTLIAYQFTVNDLLPKVGYLTSMDQYVLSSSLLVFLALVEALVTGRLASTGRAAIAEKIDLASRWLFPGIYVAIIFVTLG